MQFPNIFVLRHGETEWNLAGRIQGRQNSPLTQKGAAQARAQGEILRQFELAGLDIWVSPQGRAVQTAALALGPHVAALRTDDRLCEIGAGLWEGRLFADIQRDHPALFEQGDSFDWIGHAPQGETFLALEARCTDFLASLKRPAVLVTHGITSRMLRSVALGQGAALVSDVPGGQGNVHAVLAREHHVFEATA